MDRDFILGLITGVAVGLAILWAIKRYLKK